MADLNKNNLLYVPKIEPERNHKSDGAFTRSSTTEETIPSTEPQIDTPQSIYNDFSEAQELIRLTGIPSLSFLGEVIERLKRRLLVAFPDGKSPEPQSGDKPTIPNLPPLDPHSEPEKPRPVPSKPKPPATPMPTIPYIPPGQTYIPRKTPELETTIPPDGTPSTTTTSVTPESPNPADTPVKEITTKPGASPWHVDRSYPEFDPITDLPIEHEPDNPDTFTPDKKVIPNIKQEEEDEKHLHSIVETAEKQEYKPIEVPDLYPNITNVVLDIATPRSLVQIIQDNYARDTINLQNFYLQKLQLVLQKYFQEMLTVMAECNVDDIDKLTMDFDGEYVIVGDPNMRHLRDSVCRSQIMRNQKERMMKKMFNIDNTMHHMNRWHVAEQEREAYYAETYGDSGTFLDSHANALLRECRSQYDAAYNQSVYDMYKYLSSSCDALGDILNMTSKEAQAKGQMLKKGVDIYKNKAVEEQIAEDKRHEEELKQLEAQREANKDAQPMSMSGGKIAKGHISLEESNTASGVTNASGGKKSPGAKNASDGSGTASSAQVEKAVQIAIDLGNQGLSYEWGKEGPDSFDCTGFVSYCFSQAGFPISPCHGSAFDDAFLSMGFEEIPFSGGDCSQLQRGDILNNSQHVELYIGGGQQAGAHSRNSGVSVTDFWTEYSWESIYRYTGN